MPRPQFAQIVAGTVNADVRMTYDRGDSLDVDGSAFPYSFAPTETIEELLIHSVGAEIDIEVTTEGGATFTFPVDGPAVFNRWRIDSVKFQDPNNNSPALAASWAGE